MKTDLFSKPTPFTPPTTEEDELALLRLIRSRRVGPTTFHRLMAEHGSAHNALEALPEVARAAGVTDYEACPAGVAIAELKAGRRAGARLVVYGSPDYPKDLRDLHDAPALLWVLGDVALLTRPKIAVVGGRNASSLGTRMARRLAQDLGAAGFVTVSGLARGIDAAAHQATLDTGTIGVQAGGIDVIYPAENQRLAGDMAQKGLRVTELPPGLQPQARHFPQRNRIISGLARAVVVVEAATRSGSLLTARNALDQGREVMAVPGHPMDGRAGGCNLLIRDGAVLVRSAEDVLAALGTMPEETIAPVDPAVSARIPATAETGHLTEQILNLIGPSPTAEDQVIRDLGVGAMEFAEAVLQLELDGRILRHPGGLLSRAEAA